MFYRLKSKYSLRGWEGIAWVMLERPMNQAWRLTKEEFQALLLCDGETELSDGKVDAAIKKEIKSFELAGVVEAKETICPLNPDQYYKFYHNRFVQRVIWSVTGRCNFHCRHCYMDAPDAALGELPLETALDLIDQMADCGIFQVDFTGGEPFVRKDFWLLVDRLLSHGMTIRQVYTNGWYLDEKILDAFEERGLKPDFYISFDGTGWHDWMRGVPGAEKATLRAFELCSKRGFYAAASMCVHRGNLNTIPQTIQVLRTVGVKELGISDIDLTDLWKRNSAGNHLSRKEYIEGMIPYIKWYYQAGRPIEEFNIGGVATLYQNANGIVNADEVFDGTASCLDCYMCDSARSTCYITPEGRLLPCMPMTASPEQSKFPRVQDIGLRQGLSDSYYMQFVNGRIKDLFAANQECAACTYRYKCGGGCRAAALSGPDHNLMGCDRDMCAFWKNHYDVRILQAIQEAEAQYPLSSVEV